jgi:hypothetical protein
MATLLDKLKQTLGGAAAQTAPVADETGTVQQLLAARKGITGPATALGPKGLAVAEVAARQPAQQKLAEIGQAAQMQSTAIEQAAAGQAEAQQQREAALEGQRQESTLRNRIQTENILRGLEQGKAELGEKQRQLGLETAAANLRLSDANYVDNLRREGDRARLQEDISFTEKLQQSIFDENLALQKLKYKNQSLINASERDFNKALAQMGATEAIQIAQDNLRGDSERAMISGMTGLASAGVEAYGKGQKGAFSSGYQDYLEGLPEGTRPMSFTAFQAQQSGGATPTRAARPGYPTRPTSSSLPNYQDKN